MKIYVDEKNQDVRIDFGGEEYARVSISRFTGEVITEVAHSVLLPFILGDSELVNETPEPELEWPTKPNALVEARTLFRTQERLVRQGNYWVAIGNRVKYFQEELELKRIIFEGEDTQ